VEHVILDDAFLLRIPCWQKIHSYEADGWEGRGVMPDFETPSADALSVAHLHLLDSLRKNAKSDYLKNRYQWALDGVMALQQPAKVSEKKLRSNVGKYGNRTITFQDDVLYYQYKGRSKRRMTPVTESYFIVDGYDFFRIAFVSKGNVIIRMDEIREDGSATKLMKK